MIFNPFRNESIYLIHIPNNYYFKNIQNSWLKLLTLYSTFPGTTQHYINKFYLLTHIYGVNFKILRRFVLK